MKKTNYIDLLKMAKSGIKFKAQIIEPKNLIRTEYDHASFLMRDPVFKSWILADWEYQEIREPEVIEFKLNCKDVRPAYALADQRFGPTHNQYDSLHGKKWKLVCTEVIDE